MAVTLVRISGSAPPGIVSPRLSMFGSVSQRFMCEISAPPARRKLNEADEGLLGSVITAAWKLASALIVETSFPMTLMFGSPVIGWPGVVVIENVVDWISVTEPPPAPVRAWPRFPDPALRGETAARMQARRHNARSLRFKTDPRFLKPDT